MSQPRRTALVTGCSPGGIGNALAREFASKGLRVLATARNAASISTLHSLGIETLSLTVDDAASVRACAKEVAALTGGKLDILVNNAGRNYTVPALDVDFDEVRATFEVNLFAVMRMCQEFAPLLIEAQGTIVQIGSVAGVIPYVFGSAYNASKAALHAYSNTLRVELAPLGVKVVTIVTGGVKSNIARTDRALPEGSYYIPLNAEYQRRLKHSQEGAMPNEAYAKSVVSHVLKKSPSPFVWEGKMAWVVWFAQRFVELIFGTAADSVLSRMFNLWKLKNTATRKKAI